MSTLDPVEDLLSVAVAHLTRRPCPPTLAAALSDAVFPGGGRVRPKLVLSVAEAVGGDGSEADTAARHVLARAGAAAVELLHCASLVHDDLPCFDDADFRRGRPTVHAAYGESTAVLVGDALIVASFEVITRAALQPGCAERAVRMLVALADAAGAPRGIAAGQAWEAEKNIDLAAYHDAKTGALFEAAVVMGALAAGGDAAGWRPVGRLLGEAYQLADDLADASGRADKLGKPVRQDARHDRPNAAFELGQGQAAHRLRGALDGACEAIPACADRARLQDMVRAVGMRLLSAVGYAPMQSVRTPHEPMAEQAANG